MPRLRWERNETEKTDVRIPIVYYLQYLDAPTRQWLLLCFVVNLKQVPERSHGLYIYPIGIFNTYIPSQSSRYFSASIDEKYSYIVRLTFSQMQSLDWNQITESKKRVRCSDLQPCGNVITQFNDNIIIIEWAPRSNHYMVPKSKVERDDGTEIHLKIPHTVLSDFSF